MTNPKVKDVVLMPEKVSRLCSHKENEELCVACMSADLINGTIEKCANLPIDPEKLLGMVEIIKSTKYKKSYIFNILYGIVWDVLEKDCIKSVEIVERFEEAISSNRHKILKVRECQAK